MLPICICCACLLSGGTLQQTRKTNKNFAEHLIYAMKSVHAGRGSAQRPIRRGLLKLQQLFYVSFIAPVAGFVLLFPLRYLY